jgi:Raf kinase inhibitor-like YbhB/YbcL family protein
MKILLLLLLAVSLKTTIIVKSPAFKKNELIPSKYTCDGANINPELDLTGIPKKSKSLVIILDDPDAPNGTFDHWIMWNVPVKKKIEENSAPGIQGLNGKKENKYTGPCPPSGTHHYHFHVYALDINLNLPEASDKSTLKNAMKGHILSEGDLVGLYKR